MRIVGLSILLVFYTIVQAQPARNYVISELEFIGDSSWMTSDHPSPLTSVGDTLYEAKLENELQHITEFYTNRGYLFSTVHIDRLSPVDSTHIAIRISSHRGNLARLGGVHILGLGETDTAVITRELYLKEHPVVTTAFLQSATARLRQGLFSSVSDAKLYFITDSTIGVEYVVEETRSTYIDGVLGYSPAPTPSQSGYINGFLDLSFLNIGGSARQAIFRYERLTPAISNLSFSYKEPWLLGYPLDADLRIARHDEDSLYVATHLETSLELHTRTAISIRGGVAYDITTPTNSSSINPSDIISGLLEVTFDERDDAIAPRSGYRLVLGGKYGSKSSEDSLGNSNAAAISTLTAAGEAALSLGASNVVAYVGVLASEIHSNALESSDLFRLGGLRTIRGYSEASFLASAYAIGKFELRYMLAKRSYIGAFSDVGFSERSLATEPIRSRSYPVGFGINMLFDTQIGYVEAAIAIARSLPLDQSVVHFGLKTSF